MQKRAKKRKGLDLTKPVERPRMPVAVMVRVFLVGSIAIVASSYAIYRHYFVPRPSMLMPRPLDTAPDPASSDLVPAPEIVPAN